MMNENSNTLTNLLTPEELTQYTNTLYPFNLSILHNALKLKLQEEPGYEVWVPLIYYRFVPMMRKKDGPVSLTSYKVYISNKGRICSTQRKAPLLANPWVGTWGYYQFHIPRGKQGQAPSLHRAVGCSFIPVPEKFKGTHPKDLMINHIDGIKTNCDMLNLEWSDYTGNITHAYQNNLRTSLPKGQANVRTIAVKGTVLKGEFKGLEFVLLGDADKKEHGFHATAISAVVKGKKNKHRNCSWVVATDEDVTTLQRGINKEVIESIKN